MKSVINRIGAYLDSGKFSDLGLRPALTLLSLVAVLTVLLAVVVVMAVASLFR